MLDFLQSLSNETLITLITIGVMVIVSAVMLTWRRLRVRRIERLVIKGNAEALVNRLGHRRRAVRKAAAGALDDMGRRATFALIDGLDSDDNQVSESCAWLLGRIADPRAIAPLIGALMDRHLRDAALWSLERIGRPALIALIDALDDKYVRYAAADALDYMGWEPPYNELGATYWITRRKWDRCIDIGEPAVEPLIAVLRQLPQREGAAFALGGIGEPAIPALIKALHNPATRDGAKMALRGVGKPAIPALIQTLQYDDVAIRTAAAEVLDNLGWKARRKSDERLAYAIARHDWATVSDAGEAAISPLIAVLADNDTNTRRGASRVLGQIGEPAVKPLVAELSNEVAYAGVLAALRQIGMPAAEGLIEALRGPDRARREQAARALDSLGWKPGLDEAGMAYWVVRQNWDQCAAIGSAGLQPLLDELNDTDMAVARQVAITLGRIRDKRAMHPLILLLFDLQWYRTGPEYEVRKAAADALEAISGQELGMDPNAWDWWWRTYQESPSGVSQAGSPPARRPAYDETLVTDLTSIDPDIFSIALSRALTMGDARALSSIEEALRRMSDQETMTFFEPGFMDLINVLRSRGAYDRLLSLAREGSLLISAATTQALITRIDRSRNTELVEALRAISPRSLLEYRLLAIQLELAAKVDDRSRH